MKRLIFVFAIVPTLAFAQAPSNDDYQAALQIMQSQRDNANNQVVEVSIKLAAAQREITKLQAELKSKDKTNE
jgi:uncharacterized small protein (DUF1192 family)